MPLKHEMLPDWAQARKKFCVFVPGRERCACDACVRVSVRVSSCQFVSVRVSSCQFVAVLCAVVQPGCSFAEHVLNVRKLRVLGFGRRVAAQLIGDDHARCRFERSRRLKNRLAAAISRRFCPGMSRSAPCWSTARHNRYGSPRSVMDISSSCHVLPGLRRAALTRRAKPLPELVAPTPDCLVRYDYPALKKQFLDVAQAQLKAKMLAHGTTDDRAREAMTVLQRFRILPSRKLTRPPLPCDKALGSSSR
jgi:hypothetical protein